MMFEINTPHAAYLLTYPRTITTMPRLLILSGVSGVGKTSVCEYIRSQYPYLKVLRYLTTRKPRNNNDMKYTVSGNMEKFDYHQQLGEFFCYCTYVANQQKYGLLRSEIESVGSRDIAIFLTSYFGNALKAQDPQKVLNIWLICTDETVLLRRLKHRATEGQPEIANRYREAINEQNFILSRQNQFITERKIDHVIDTAYKDVRQVAHEVQEVIRHRLEI